MTKEEIKLRDDLLAAALDVVKRTEDCAKLMGFASPDPEIIEQCDPETVVAFCNAQHWSQVRFRNSVDVFLELNRQLQESLE